MAQFLFSQTCMNLNKINRKYTLQQDIYDVVLEGVSSRLMGFDNGIISLEVRLGKKSKRSLGIISYELAHSWKRNIPELSHALGCKLYFLDGVNDPNAAFLYQSGIRPAFLAKKGILFYPSQLN
jgi:hypothetical protein